MKIRLKPIELEVITEVARGWWVGNEEIDEKFIPRDWAEPVPEPIKPGTLCVFWEGKYHSGPYFDRYEGREGDMHRCRSSVESWEYARPVTPEDLRRWAGEEDDHE